MNISSKTTGDVRTLALSGRLAADTVEILDQSWFEPGISQLVVDLAECRYVSSAGLRVFMAMARDAKSHQIALSFVNVLPEVLQVMELTGLVKLLVVSPKPREISMNGLEFLSAGVCGECFRIDAETIVKLYNEGVSREVAEQEKAFARAALIAGIPTALSYEVVACGKRTGVVYEMLDAKLLSRVIDADSGNLSHHAALLAEIARTVHSTVGDPSVFPNLKQRLRGSIDALRGHLEEADVDHLLARLDRIPDAETLVHFDLHASNIMIRNGEPVIIDMGDVSRGHPLFDVGVIATIYAYPETGNCEFVTRLPNDTGRRLYDAFLDAYFAHRPTKEREFFVRNEAFLASLRLIAAMAFLPAARDALLEKVRDFLMPRIRREAGHH